MVFFYDTTVFFQRKAHRLYSINSVIRQAGPWLEKGKAISYKHQPKGHKIVAPYETIDWDS